MNKDKLNKLTTKADYLYTAMESEENTLDIQDFMDDTKGFLDETVSFLESIGGKVDGMSYTEKKNVVIHGYVDQLLDNTDGRVENKFDSCWFIVPEVWAEEQAQARGFTNLEEFFNEYTYDDTDEWIDMAIDHDVLQGAGIGKIEE
jgi:hypothetical protein